VVDLVGGLHCSEKFFVVIYWIMTLYSLTSTNQHFKEPATSIIRAKVKMDAAEFLKHWLSPMRLDFSLTHEVTI